MTDLGIKVVRPGRWSRRAWT